MRLDHPRHSILSDCLQVSQRHRYKGISFDHWDEKIREHREPSQTERTPFFYRNNRDRTLYTREDFRRDGELRERNVSPIFHFHLGSELWRVHGEHRSHTESPKQWSHRENGL